MPLYIDFETRSRRDLPNCGVYNYAQDRSTEVLCMSYAFDDGDVSTWIQSEPFPDAVRNYSGMIYAHNAAFERLVFWYVLQINFKLEQFYCTATQARANCAPGGLEDAGRFAGASMRKDHRGAQLIRLLSIPRHDGTFNEDPQLMKEMVEYCEQDVKVMRAVSQSMRPLSDEELADYHVNERINDRGVKVDVPLCFAAMQYAAKEQDDIQQIVRDVTNNEITSVRSPKMREWVAARLGPEALKLMRVYKDGEPKQSIDKSVRANLLAIDDPEQVPPDVKEVIQCADDLWASSVAKFERLSNLADDEDERVRGAFVFAGGAATGRASSYGAQVHNFTRKVAKDPEATRQAMVRGHELIPNHGKRITDVLRGMLRPALIPEKGNVFVVADWRAIEARMNPWLSNEPEAEAVLDVFRSGRDIYMKEAAGIYKVSEDQVTLDQRFIGKVASLACGYGGGLGAFTAMGRGYGLVMQESDAKRTVDAWRRANVWAVRYWQNLETAYTRAMRNARKEFSAGRVTYMFDGQHLWYALPSGRILCYPFAKLEEEGITYAKASWKPEAKATEWPRTRLWKGLAAENICQAAANDVLRHSLRNLTDCVLHVHDEIVIECRAEEAEENKERLEAVMVSTPDWAIGLPLAVEVKIMSRYGK
jgi:DNA polymerase